MTMPLFSNRLLLLPLFQGFSRLDFIDIVEKTPFDFRTISPKGIVVSQGTTCKCLCMVLNGKMSVETDSPEHTYRLTESVSAPHIIQIENLFGLHNKYTRTYRAQSEVQLVMLDKQSVRQLLVVYPAFQINFYNAVSTCAQSREVMLWSKRSDTVEGRFRTFLLKRCSRPIGQKQLKIRMEDLASELGATRLRVSQMLADLAAKNKIIYSRGIIHVQSLENL